MARIFNEEELEWICSMCGALWIDDEELRCERCLKSKIYHDRGGKNFWLDRGEIKFDSPKIWP